MNLINLYKINGDIFKEIIYSDINNLTKILNELLEEYNTDSFIQLILNNIIINDGNESNNFNFYKINLEIEIQKTNIFQVVFVSKKLLYICLNIENNKLFLNKKYKFDNYYKLLNYIIIDDSANYEFIMNISYKDLIIKAVKTYPCILQYANSNMKNDIDVILASTHKYSLGLYYANDNIKNNKDLIYKIIKKNNDALEYASNEVLNNKEIILILVKLNGLVLYYINTDFKNDKDIVLAAVKQNSLALKYASYELKNDEDIILAASKQNDLTLNNIQK